MEHSDVDADVDVRDPDEKSIMTYVAQFLQYSRDLPVPEEEMQVCMSLLYSTQGIRLRCTNICRKVVSVVLKSKNQFR